MSISSALSNALSGLTVASRSADIVSSNIANAMTDGYGVRSLDTASRIIGNSGAGARILGVTRHEDTVLVGQRRHAEAELASTETRRGFLGRLETLIGTPDQPGSLSARSAWFEAALIEAANTPQSPAHLTSAVDAARALSGQVNTISDGIQAERLWADGEIGRQVDRVNATLSQLADLNVRIRQGQGGGRDVSSLLDAQAKLVDVVAPIIPLQTRRDTTGALQIYSQDGQALLDGRPAVLGFTPVSAMAPGSSLQDGTLGGLTLNGRALTVSGQSAALQGGDLAALFALRDNDAVAAQSRIDAVALDLTQRFDRAGLDTTLAPGAAGVFTDAGQKADPALATGLAGRLRINASLLPEEGGAAWRLRDGLGASVEGAPGNSALLLELVGAMAVTQVTPTPAFPNAARSFAALVSDHLTQTARERQSAEIDQTHIALRHGALQQEELAQGVDTDAEMQNLLRIEQAYAANARVIAAVEDMLDRLMELGR